MEVYKAESRESLRRFRDDGITQNECLAALHDALHAVIPTLNPADLRHIQALLKFNDAAVVREMYRRTQSCLRIVPALRD